MIEEKQQIEVRMPAGSNATPEGVMALLEKRREIAMKSVASALQNAVAKTVAAYRMLEGMPDGEPLMIAMGLQSASRHGVNATLYCAALAHSTRALTYAVDMGHVLESLELTDPATNDVKAVIQIMSGRRLHTRTATEALEDPCWLLSGEQPGEADAEEVYDMYERQGAWLRTVPSESN